jgi:hypothetical protein
MTETPATATTPADAPLRDDLDARMREDQWRTPELALMLLTPILAVIALMLNLMGSPGNANVALALTIITGVGAALIGIQIWRLRRIAIGDIK